MSIILTPVLGEAGKRLPDEREKLFLDLFISVVFSILIKAFS